MLDLDKKSYQRGRGGGRLTPCVKVKFKHILLLYKYSKGVAPQVLTILITVLPCKRCIGICPAFEYILKSSDTCLGLFGLQVLTIGFVLNIYWFRS